MWSFLGLLLIFVVFMGSKTNHTVFDKQYDRSRELENDAFDRFCDRVSSDFDAEAAIVEKVIGCSGELDDIASELRKVTGINPTHPMIVWGSLAKIGKTPSRMTMMHVTRHTSVFSCAHDRAWSNAYKEHNVREICDARLRFLKWYDRELRSKGFEYELMAAPVNGRLVDFSRAVPAQRCIDAMGMVFYWEPAKMCVTGLV